ncbi:MAG TPA: DUF1616 domain-containing protein [Candidatus Thermoplasmatota archaeon]|nr:DUF1616 domain-containing protein [Candidatus Thermoplasmatota archaeon]
MQSQRGDDTGPPSLGSIFDLVGLAVAALVSTAAVWFEAPPLLRVPAGTFLLLFAPGYALVAALFPERRRAQAKDGLTPLGLTGLERFALALGAGVGLVPILGVATNTTPTGLAPRSVAVSLFAITLLLAIAGGTRRLRLAPADRFDPFANARLASRHAAKLPAGATLAVVGLLVLAGVGAAAHLASIEKPPARYTSFELLDEYGRSAAYVTSVEAGSAARFRAVVANQEGVDLVYTIDYALERGAWSHDGPGARFVPQSTVEARSFEVPVSAGSRESFDLEVPAADGGLHRFGLVLFAPGIEERRLSFWFDARPPLSSEVVVGLSASSASTLVGRPVVLTAAAMPASSASVAVDLILFAERGNLTSGGFTPAEVMILDRWRFDLTPGEPWSATVVFSPAKPGAYRLTALLDGTTPATHPNGRGTVFIEVSP